jgi:drug/metabolite transporter (DMT)-like permease
MSHSESAAAPTRSRVMTRAEWGMMLLLSLLWGGSFLFVGIAVRDVPVVSIVAFRVALAALVLHLVLRLTGRAFPLTRESIVAFAGMGILNSALPFCLIAFGQTRIESGLASILNALTPIFTMILAHLLTRDEKIGGLKAIGVVLGFAGVVILFSGRDLAIHGAITGQIACMLAALSYGFSNIFGRRFSRLKMDPIVMATGQLTASATLMVPLALIVDAPFSRPLPGGQALLALLALALASTAGAYILFFRILSRAGATNASLVTLLIPCSAILLGSVVLGEAPGLREFAGFLTLAFGLLVIDGRLIRLFLSRMDQRPPL